MKKLLMALCLLLAFTAASPAFADMSMLCDIGTIKIQSNNLAFQEGQLSAEGELYIFPRDNQQTMGWYNDNGGLDFQLKFTWDGSRKNILSTKYGDIILIPHTGTPRLDIELPQPDSRDGDNIQITINHDQRLKQQGCILQ